MIHRPTVFVLGAGASQPYGFPLGSELRTAICNATKERDVAREVLRDQLRIADNEIYDFANAFRRSRISSIDSFLVQRRGDVQIGKFLIAANLCLIEDSDRLFEEPNNDDWYRLLWNAMVRDAHTPQDILQNQVRFITFNYDRSLEYFLHETITHTYGISRSEAARIVPQIPILHVYGLLGTFKYEGLNGTRPYQPNCRADSLRIAADGIRIIPEQRHDSPEFANAKSYLDWADVICFLGFGFDTLNCQRLTLPPIIEKKIKDGRPLQVVASVMGLTAAERGYAQQLVTGGNIWTPYDATNSQTLRESGILLS